MESKQPSPEQPRAEVNNSDDEPSVITDSLSMHSAKRLKIEARKLDGMQRELYSLIGENPPPVVVTQTNKFKSRPEWQQKATPWALASFEPKEGLQLKHWVRAAALADGTSGHRFSRFNTEVQVPSWTEKDYEFFPKTGFLDEKNTDDDKEEHGNENVNKSENEIKKDNEKDDEIEAENESQNDAANDVTNDDSRIESTGDTNHKDEGRKSQDEPQEEFVEWTLEETRYLFDLAKDYDIRWAVIADRYNFPGTNRSIDDLKERYYDVCRALVQNKAVVKELGLSPHEEEYLQSIKFSKSRETKRKAHLERLLSRNPGDVAEEEALILEARRLESISSRIAAERKELMRVLESPMSLNHKVKHEISSSHGVGQLLQDLQGEKSKRSSSASNQTKNVAPLVSKALNRKLTEREIVAYGISYYEAIKVKHSGVFIRSAKIAPIRQNTLPKVKMVLTELGLPLKPVMPTLHMCTQYENLYQSINTLLEAKKIQDKLEMEIDVLKKTKEKMLNSSAQSNEVAIKENSST